MIKVEQLQLVKRNTTVDILINFFSSIRAISNETSLESFRIFLVNRGYTIDNNDYYQFFRDLHSAEAGTLFDNVRGNTKFIWRYPIKETMDQLKNPNKVVNLEVEDKESDEIVDSAAKNNAITTLEESIMEKPEVKKKGRPFGSKNRVRKSELGRVSPRRAVRRAQRGLKEATKADPSLETTSKELPPSGVHIKEATFEFTTVNGKVISLNLSEINYLSDQLIKIRRLVG